MGQIVNSASIYGASGTGIGGLKEDFKTLSGMDARTTPLFDLLPEGPKAEANLIEHDVETISAPSSAKVVSGADFTFGVQNETSKIYNYVQESVHTWELGAKSQNAAFVGRVSEKARRMNVAVSELKRSIEYDIINNSAIAAGTNTGPVAAQAGGFEYWFTTNNVSIPALTQDAILDVLGSIADYTGDRARKFYLVGNAAIVGALSKMSLSAPTAININQTNQTLDIGLSKLITSFGVVEPLLVGTSLPNKAYLIDTTSMDVRFMAQQDGEKKERGMVHIKVADPSVIAPANAYRGAFSSFWTLIVKDEKLNAKFTVG